jgi:hypothetical protein
MKKNIFLGFLLLGLILFTGFFTSEFVRARNILWESTVEKAIKEVSDVRSAAVSPGRRCIEIPDSETSWYEGRARVDYYEKEFYHNELTYRDSNDNPINRYEAVDSDSFKVCWLDVEPNSDPYNSFNIIQDISRWKSYPLREH